jgi:hypothetical protein
MQKSEPLLVLKHNSLLQICPFFSNETRHGFAQWNNNNYAGKGSVAATDINDVAESNLLAIVISKEFHRDYDRLNTTVHRATMRIGRKPRMAAPGRQEATEPR